MKIYGIISMLKMFFPHNFHINFHWAGHSQENLIVTVVKYHSNMKIFEMLTLQKQD